MTWVIVLLVVIFVQLCLMHNSINALVRGQEKIARYVDALDHERFKRDYEHL